MAILRSGLVKYVIIGSEWKDINLIIEYINYLFTINIKYNKNSIYNIKFNFTELLIIRPLTTAIRKIIEFKFRRLHSGRYINLSTNLDIINYIYTIYRNGFIIQRYR